MGNVPTPNLGLLTNPHIVGADKTNYLNMQTIDALLAGYTPGCREHDGFFIRTTDEDVTLERSYSFISNPIPYSIYRLWSFNPWSGGLTQSYLAKPDILGRGRGSDILGRGRGSCPHNWKRARRI